MKIIKIYKNSPTSPERRACGTTLEPLLIIIILSTSSQPASQPASPADRSDKSMNQRIDDSQLESTNKVFYRGHMSPLTVFRRPPSQSISQPASLVMFTIKTSTKEQIATRTLVATHPHYEYHGWILAAPPMVREHGAPPLMSSHVDPPTSDDRITTLSLGI